MAEVARTFSVTSRGVGLPDYSTAAPVGQVPIGPIYSSSDVGELAARLGSPVTHDRRGNVIWIDDFEDNLNKWRRVATGTGAGIALSAEQCLWGSQSCKMTTGITTLNTTSLRRDLPYPHLSPAGFAISFTVPPEDIRIALTVGLYNGITSYSWNIDYQRPLHILRCFTGAGNITFAENVNLYEIFPFHFAKIVIDPATGRFVRFTLNSTEYDISAYSGFSAASVTFPALYVAISLFPLVAGVNMTSFVDSAIVTINEP